MRASSRTAANSGKVYWSPWMGQSGTGMPASIAPSALPALIPHLARVILNLGAHSRCAVVQSQALPGIQKAYIMTGHE